MATKQASKFLLDGKPLEMKRPTPRVESIIKVLDRLPANEFLTTPELASRMGITIPAITIASQTGAAWLRGYTHVSTSLGVWRKKIFGSKQGIKALQAHLENETARNNRRS